jgi:hypothetical protein
MITRTLRHYTLRLAFILKPTWLRFKPFNSMESAPSFERANALKVLAFKVEANHWFRWRAALPSRANQGGGVAGSRSKRIQSLVGQNRSPMNKIFDAIKRIYD